ERWGAVVAHDAGADGAFVYAVRSTGVYCRPSCPSRRPLRRNVEFFDAPAEAEAGGYRPCLRCGGQAGSGAPTGRAARAVAEACRLLDGADEAPRLSDLARSVGLSPYYLQRSFKRLVGSTPRQYAAASRLERAKAGMRNGSGVTASLFDAGYGSTRAFYEDATGALGMPPATYRRGGAAQDIAYTTVPSPLGALLVAATEHGVCAVRFVEAGDRAGVEEVLRAEFPAASLTRDDDGLRATAARVVEAAGGRGADDLALPLDVRATAFQLRVWRALREIPRGETRSYTEVARSIGQPRAVRAVASACAANPVALVVPCHRVVAAGGGLAGYRWGVERKRALLEAERAAAPPPAAESSVGATKG
ncbi:MAG: bifunctional DNA-binding transcriptional regulator/O6-methylguanine-DNA methyltransferase Ada, partial [Acidimicrobiales bacterium]